MDYEEYRRRGKEMVDYIADYLENIRERRVFPDVKPGYMHNLLPDSAPIEGEKWDNIFLDIERVIMPGITHWQSPHMHAYFPALNSFPSLLADMLADAINCLGFTWASSPACTELEIIVMNWLGKMIGLPDEFLHLNNESKGGGVIQTTASESTLVCLLAGRTQAIKRFHEKTPGYQDAEINARLVAYCSDQAHSSVEKAALIGLVRMRYIESDENLTMLGKPLEDAIKDDIKKGLIPFWVCCTLGTTGACAFDNLDEVGTVCNKYKIWLHIDAAYAGSALICPEYRMWLKGIEKADSIAFNPSKWLMVHFDCTAMWVKESTAVHRTFNVEPLYLKHENSGLAIDYMHWQIPLSKRFRSLKLWFVLRSYGIKGLQAHIREGVRLAQKFEALVLADHRFEIPAVRHLGMVVFRIKGENELTERLLKRLNNRGKLHCVPASLKGKYIIRFTVTSTRTTSEDIINDWSEIKQVTTQILEEMNVKISDRARVSLKDTKEKNEAFGSSLLLSNAPMSPKIVNGSFAAIFDEDEFLAKTFAGIRIAHQDSPNMRRRVRGILMSAYESPENPATSSSQTSASPVLEENVIMEELMKIQAQQLEKKLSILPSIEQHVAVPIQTKLIRMDTPISYSQYIPQTNKFKNFMKHSLSFQNQFETLYEKPTETDESTKPIYHGKRFLEDPKNLDTDFCSFYNHAFGLNRRLSRTYDNSLIDSLGDINFDEVDWETVKENFSAATTPDKELKSILFPVKKESSEVSISLDSNMKEDNDQTNKTTSDSTSSDEDSSQESNLSCISNTSSESSSRSSLDCNKSNATSETNDINNDDWKCLSQSDTNVSLNLCKKCGHHSCSSDNNSS